MAQIKKPVVKTTIKPKVPVKPKLAPTNKIKEKQQQRDTPKQTGLPKTITKMTPQDAAMKKLLEKKYGKIYG